MRLLIGLVLVAGCGAPGGPAESNTSQRPGATDPFSALRYRGAEMEKNQQGEIVGVRMKYAQVSDEDLRPLEDLRRLRSLEIASCPRITTNALVPLRTVSSLRSLTFTFCPRITDNELAQLRHLDRLTNLSLDGCTGITDAGLDHLEDLAQLETLSLRDTWITYDRMLSFQKTLPKCRVRHTWTSADRTEGSTRREHTAEHYRELGMSRARQGRPGDALSALDTVVSLLPLDARAYNDRGYAHQLGKNLDKAIDDYTAAILVYPDFGLAYFNRGVAYRERGETEKADDDLAAAEALGYDESPR